MSTARPVQYTGVDGITLVGDEWPAEPSGRPTILMLHGWPDTYRLWDGMVAALAPQYRCVRFTLPGFETPAPGKTRTLAEMTAQLLAIVDTVSPTQPVTLLLHDWGCIFGYELAMRHPERVNRIVGIDIGDHHFGAAAFGAFGKSIDDRLMCNVFGIGAINSRHMLQSIEIIAPRVWNATGICKVVFVHLFDVRCITAK